MKKKKEKIVTLFDVAASKAVKKNYAKPILKTNKDVRAFLSVAEIFVTNNLHNAK